MTITEENTVGDIVELCPNYQEIFEKHWGKAVPDMILKLAKPLKVRHTAKRAGWSQERTDAFLEDVNAQIARIHTGSS